MAEQLVNQVQSTINMSGGLDHAATTVTLLDGSKFPSTGNYRLLIENEILLATARSSNDITVTRGQEGTTATAHSNGATVTIVLTAGGLEQYISENGGGGGGGMTNPMTTAEDIIKGGSGGTPARLGKGSDGQVLTVVSGVVSWATPSGGMTNPMTTADDMIVGGSGGTPTRPPIGSKGQVMQVVSGVPTWGAAPAGTPSFHGCRCFVDSGQSIASGSFATALTCGSEDFDTDAYHSTSSNTDRITIPTGLGGYYDVYGEVNWGGTDTTSRISLLKLNGSTLVAAQAANGGADGASVEVRTTLHLSAGDFLQLIPAQLSGSSLNVSTNALGRSVFGCNFIGT